MSDINKVIFVGNVTKDAEVKTSNGFVVCNFTVAVNTNRKQGDQWVNEANFIEVVLFGKQAESIGKYLVKGKQIAVDGELKQDRWEYQGKPCSKLIIKANFVQLLNSNSSEKPTSSNEEVGF